MPYAEHMTETMRADLVLEFFCYRTNQSVSAWSFCEYIAAAVAH